MASANGTLERLAARAVHVCRGNAGLIPVMFFAVAVLLSSIGPGNISTTAILAPMAMAVGAQSGDSAVPDGPDGGQRRPGGGTVALCADGRDRERHHGPHRPSGRRVRDVQQQFDGAPGGDARRLPDLRRGGPVPEGLEGDRRKRSREARAVFPRALADPGDSGRPGRGRHRLGPSGGDGRADGRRGVVARRRGGREGGDPQDAVGRRADGLRRHGADRRAGEDAGDRPSSPTCWRASRRHPR